MKRIRTTYLLLVLLQLPVLPVFSQQSIVTSAEKSSILLGEPLKLTISIKGGQSYKAVIPDSLGRFEVLERLPAKTTKNDGTVTSIEQIIVTSFDSGALRIPPIAVEGNPAIVSPGVDVMVNTLPPDSTTNYGDIKQIIDLKEPSQWPYIIALSLLALLSAFLIYWFNRKHQKAESLPEEKIEIVSPNNLVKQLALLKTQWQQGAITSLPLGNQLMEIFRKFLAGRGIHSSSKTGEELIIATRTMYDTEKWQQIVQSIRLCNAMRFGKYNAIPQEGTDAITAFETAITANRSQSGDNRFQPTESGQAAIKNS